MGQDPLHTTLSLLSTLLSYFFVIGIIPDSEEKMANWMIIPHHNILISNREKIPDYQSFYLDCLFLAELTLSPLSLRM